MREAAHCHSAAPPDMQPTSLNRSAVYRSRPLRKACRWLGIGTKRTGRYQAQTNGQAKRMIQTLPRKWTRASSVCQLSTRDALATPLLLQW